MSHLLALCVILAQAADKPAKQLLLDMPDEYAKLNSFQMKVIETITVAGEQMQVQTDAAALKPNLFVIVQNAKVDGKPQERKFVCDGKLLAFPEPRRPSRYIGDPQVYDQWAGFLRSFGSLMFDNGPPLAVAFRTKQEVVEFVGALSNIRDGGTVELPDGKARRVTAEMIREGDAKPTIEIEVLVSEDGLMRRMTLRSRVLMQMNLSPVTEEVIGQADADGFVTTVVWDVRIERNPPLETSLFKLPPLRNAPTTGGGGS